MTESFGVPGENGKRMKVVDFCAEKNLCCKRFLPTQEDTQVYIEECC